MPHAFPATGEILAQLRALALELRAATLRSLTSMPAEELAAVTGERGGDVIYRLDERSEAVLLAFCERWGGTVPLRLVAEGLEGADDRDDPDDALLFPAGGDPKDVAFTLIVDPIDGTRGLMYGKRSAWALFGVAPTPADGRPPTLADITVALQAEAPTPRAALADLLWAVQGKGAHGETHDLRTGAVTPFRPQPSRATTLANGFATVCNFFPGAKALTAEIEEQFFAAVMGAPPPGSPQVFADQYISSGGQLYELMVGHDRFVADLRPLIELLSAPDETPHTRLCCHPYDICTELIAREAGVIVTDPWGQPLGAPLDTHTPVAWVSYANDALRQRLAPALQQLLRERGLTPP